jgi:hypothetical protein
MYIRFNSDTFLTERSPNFDTRKEIKVTDTEINYKRQINRPTNLKGTGKGDLKYREQEGQNLKKKQSSKMEDTYRRRDNNKGHKQKCHQNSMKQHRKTSEEHRGAPPWNGQQHKYCWGA